MRIGDFVANANVRMVRHLLRALVEGNAVGGDAFVSQTTSTMTRQEPTIRRPGVAPSSFAKASSGSTAYLLTWSSRSER